MARMHPLERPFRRHLRTFRRSLPAAIDGEVEPLHQCRVATRRLRELAPLVSAELGDKATRKVTARLREVGRALGPVRELDVALELLDDVTRDGRTQDDAVVRTRQYVTDLRTAARRQMLETLDRNRAAKLGRRLGGVADALRESTASVWPRTLSLRMHRRAQHLRETVDAAGALYVPDRVHAVRIAAKKLRYAFELAADAGATRRRVPARHLKAVQDTLGRLHDIEVLINLMRAQPLPAPPPPVWVAHADELRQRLETECRRQHSEFVGDRRRLIRAGVAAFDTAGRIWSRRFGAGTLPAPLKMSLAAAGLRPTEERRRSVSGG